MAEKTTVAKKSTRKAGKTSTADSNGKQDAVNRVDGATATPAGMTTAHPDLGISAEASAGVVNILTTVLADEFTLYTKLRKYHWNVTGPEFFQLHEVFEVQYTALAEVIDDLAERIRSHGAPAIGTLAEFAQHARLSEQPGVVPEARQMVADIVADHEAMVRNLRSDIDTIDDEYDEVGAEDLLTGFLQVHQKMGWLLRSMLEGKGGW